MGKVSIKKNLQYTFFGFSFFVSSFLFLWVISYYVLTFFNFSSEMISYIIFSRYFAVLVLALLKGNLYINLFYKTAKRHVVFTKQEEIFNKGVSVILALLFASLYFPENSTKFLLFSSL